MQEQTMGIMSMKKKKEIIDRYCTPIGGGKYVTTTKNKEMLCLTAHPPQLPLYKQLRNYVIEEYDKEDD